jgi:release factor glutamine methyltransferase
VSEPFAASDATASEAWASGLARAADVLQAARCESPRLDAELLLAEALGTTRTALYLRPAAPLDAAAVARFDALLARRAAREPVAYILGRKEFRQLSLFVDRRVLVPRPETELLVDVGLSLASGARVVDVGTGSGAVALALKDERPDLDVTGTDASLDAVEVARENARRLGLNVRFMHADLIAGGSYDAVLANLPYVADDEQLAPEIERFEPVSALRGGHDGLDVVRRLVADAGAAAVPIIALEIGAGQADAVADSLRGAGFDTVERLSDLAGHQRVLVGRR